MATKPQRAAALIAGSALVALLRWAARARLPDDYDSIGFVRALGRYDLAALQPHFPGYPVYVALGRAATTLGLSPLAAATCVSALAAGVTAAAVWQLARAAAGGARAAGWTALALYAAAWLPWMLGGAALSDATATAFVALAFAALTIDGTRAAAVGGVAIALALGTRASYWPLALSFAVVAAGRPRARVVFAAAAVGLVGWMVPFVVVVGPRALVGLARTHLGGHFTSWGGTIVTQPDVALRLWAFARGLAYDGLFAHPAALAVAAVALAVAAWRTRSPAQAQASSPSPLPSSRARRLAVVVAVPYAAWVLVAQNVIEQPRHLLPLVTFACAGVAVVVARTRALAAVVVLAALAASLPLAHERAVTAPAAAQAARWTAATYPARDGVVVFGARSLRFFDELAPSLLTRKRTWLSEVDVDLERLDVLPPNILVTSEVEADPTRARRLHDGPTFCRDARLDRGQPCLTLRSYRIGTGATLPR